MYIITYAVFILLSRRETMGQGFLVLFNFHFLLLPFKSTVELSFAVRRENMLCRNLENFPL